MSRDTAGAPVVVDGVPLDVELGELGPWDVEPWEVDIGVAVEVGVDERDADGIPVDTDGEGRLVVSEAPDVAGVEKPVLVAEADGVPVGAAADGVPEPEPEPLPEEDEPEPEREPLPEEDELEPEPLPEEGIH